MTKMTLPHDQWVRRVLYVFYTAAAGKQTKMAVGGNKVEKEDSLRTGKWWRMIILAGLMTLKTE